MFKTNSGQDSNEQLYILFLFYFVAQTFQAIDIDLGQKDVRRTVYSILEKCNLPTSYVDSIPKSKWDEASSSSSSGTGRPSYTETQYWAQNHSYEEIEREVAQKKSTHDDLE
jgi:hypothetical protein